MQMNQLQDRNIPESCFLLTQEERGKLLSRDINAPITYSAQFDGVFVECFGKRDN
jgi:hypothetical protein